MQMIDITQTKYENNKRTQSLNEKANGVRSRMLTEQWVK